MNQILITKSFNTNIFQNNTISIKKMNNILRTKIIFWISIITLILCLSLYISLQYTSLKNIKIAKNLENKFEIQNLYSSENNSYIAQRTISDSTLSNLKPFVIGLIKIDKIDLMYPILSESSDELLEISPCRFYGPMPNEIGNLCIAGHNYANNTHFGKLYLLEEGDIIQIFDLTGKIVDYEIYYYDEISSDDISCLSQETNNLKELTLITCNTLNGKRKIIKAREQ